MAGDFLPFLVMVIVQLGYAGMNIISKLAMDSGMNPFVHVAYRQLSATICLIPFAYFLERLALLLLPYYYYYYKLYLYMSEIYRILKNNGEDLLMNNHILQFSFFFWCICTMNDLFIFFWYQENTAPANFVHLIPDFLVLHFWVALPIYIYIYIHYFYFFPLMN